MATTIYDAGKAVAFQRLSGATSVLPSAAATIGTLTFLADSGHSSRTYLYLQTASSGTTNVNISALYADTAHQVDNPLYFGGTAAADDKTITTTTTSASYDGHEVVRLQCLPVSMGGTGQNATLTAGRLIYTKTVGSGNDARVVMAQTVGSAATNSINISESSGTWTITPGTTGKLNLGTSSLKLGTIYASTFSGTASAATYASKISPTLTFGTGTAATDNKVVSATTSSSVTFGGSGSGTTTANTSMYITCIPVIFGGTGNTSAYVTDRLMYSTYVDTTSGATKIEASSTIAINNTNATITPVTDGNGSLGTSGNKWGSVYATTLYGDLTGTAEKVENDLIIKLGQDAIQINYNGDDEEELDLKDVIQSFTFSTTAATKTFTVTNDLITSDTQLINYVITSGAQYVSGPLSWEAVGSSKQFKLTVPGTANQTITGIAYIARTRTLTAT